MKLNLSVIRDHLQGVSIVDSACSAGALRFDRPICYQDGPIQRNGLYLCEAAALPEQPPFSKGDHVSVIALGDLPQAWIGKCEYIIVDPETRFFDLLNSVSDVFIYFQKWELSLNKVIRSGGSLHELGELFLEVFDNPIDFVTNFFKEVILVSDPKRKHPPHWFSFYHEGEFLQEDEIQIIFADEEYRESLSTKGAAIFSAAIYGFRMLYQNLSVKGEYVGRLTVSEIYRDFRDSDISLLPVASEYFLDLYVRTELQNIGLPGQMEKMVGALLAGGSYLHEYDELLAARNWRRNDNYVCLSIVQRRGSKKVSLATSAAYLTHVLPLSMIYTQKDRIIVLFNETRSKNASVTFQQIDQFCKKNGFIAGISLAYNDFAQLKAFSIQASDALRLGPKSTPGQRMYYSRNLLLDKLVDAARQAVNPTAYISRQVRQLISYDTEHNTELCKTLLVSLKNNMNSVHSAKALSLSRTAYLYRIQRIVELTGYDLSDYRTRLYLMLLFELAPEELMELAK